MTTSIIPSIDDLQAHGLWSVRLMHALIDFGTARTLLELELGKLPKWYWDRLAALAASAGPVEGRLVWLSDIQRAVPTYVGPEWHRSSATVETAAAQN